MAAVPDPFAHANAVAMTPFVARLRRRSAALRAPTCSHGTVIPVCAWTDQTAEIAPFAGGAGSEHPLIQTSEVTAARVATTVPTLQTMPSESERLTLWATELATPRARLSMARVATTT